MHKRFMICCCIISCLILVVLPYHAVLSMQITRRYHEKELSEVIQHLPPRLSKITQGTKPLHHMLSSDRLDQSALSGNISTLLQIIRVIIAVLLMPFAFVLSLPGLLLIMLAQFTGSFWREYIKTIPDEILFIFIIPIILGALLLYCMIGFGFVLSLPFWMCYSVLVSKGTIGFIDWFNNIDINIGTNSTVNAVPS